MYKTVFANLQKKTNKNTHFDSNNNRKINKLIKLK